MSTPTETSPGGSAFPPTHWSIVLAAGDKQGPESAAALEKLCRVYWPPLYAYARRFGHTPEDAQDITQDFFARLLAGDWLVNADREKGRFRTFLLTALKRFMITQWQRARAQKRGGGLEPISLDTELGETLFSGVSQQESPDRAYDRHCALAVLRSALDELRREFGEAGKRNEFEAMKPYLTAGKGDICYDDLAKRLNRDPGAARVAVHRFRKRYRQVFRNVVAGTVARPEDVDDELHCLVDALGAANAVEQ